ncbi:hypothetical protein [Streptomonospora litoralis]|uniref:Uncharacterized protein n=1 Tax=Streptomonospora litoralis TaxID=2498135 RepID=A0A4V0ZJA7_9ACTN|nr:hypothetical protein [Streptomonospora litoralis]QBI52822.1 hypothetical protein EKD16_05075 [Streptomonospora litoralis]
MATARTRIYTDDMRLFWQQLGKVALGGATLFGGCALWGIRDAVLWASAAVAVASMAAMVLLAWRTRVPYGRVRFVLDGGRLHYRRCRGRRTESRDYDLCEIASVQLRMHVGSAQSLEFGFDSHGLPELRIETLSGESDSYQIVALDLEGCEEFRSFVTHVCTSAGMEKRRQQASVPVTVVDRWDKPTALPRAA